MEHDHLQWLHQLQHNFADGVTTIDPELPVPWCGRWKVRNLVTHLARVHHWAAAQARRQHETPLGRGPFDLQALYPECAQELRETLAELDPDQRAWTLLDDGLPREQHHGTVRFWHRRQALETLIHTWDLRTAAGQPFDVPSEWWLDCVDEVATVMYPRQVRLDRAPAASVRIELVSDEPAGAVIIPAPAGAPICRVEGSAHELALLVWGRRPLDGEGLSVTGDRAALEEVLSAGLTP